MPEFLVAVGAQVGIISAGRTESVWASKSSVVAEIGRKQDAGVANGPGRRGSGADGWKGFAGELLCGVRGAGRSEWYFALRLSHNSSAPCEGLVRGMVRRCACAR
jgi:hypothetical protein